MIASFDELADYLGLSGVASATTPLAMCLTAADAIMRSYCNRSFESSRINRYITPVNYFNVLLPDYPLTAVHGITAFQFINDTMGYPCNLDFVKFYRSGKIYDDEGVFVDFPNSVLVECTAGYTVDDSDWDTLKWVNMEIAAELFRGRGLLHLQQYQTGGMQLTRANQLAPDLMSMLSPEIFVMLNMFAVRGPRIDY